MSEHEQGEIEDTSEEQIDEERMEDHLAEALRVFAEDQGDPDPGIETFARAGLLTNDHGLVVQLGDSEFQITIRRSR